MAKVTALFLDTITEKSGHQMIGMAVSVCLTPAAPTPLPIPYPTFGTTLEGITDPCMRTKIEGSKILTVGGCMSKCHGNEPGTLLEIVSLNITGPCFPWLGAPTVWIELGMAGITGSLGQMNKSPTFGVGANASGAGGSGSGGGGALGGAGGTSAGGPQGGSDGGGGGGGSNSGAAPPSPPAPPSAEGQASAGHPVDVITGTLFTSPTADFKLPGPFWIYWLRQYRTSSVERSCGIGWGWSHALAWHAEQQGDELVLVDDTLTATTLMMPGAEEPVLLPFNRRLERKGDALHLDLHDGMERVLLREPGTSIYRLRELRDAHGNTAEITWDQGEIVMIVDTVGRRAELERTGNLRLFWISVTDAEGAEHRHRAVTYELDERGDLVRVIDAGGVETLYAYDDHHYLVEERRPDGVVFRFIHEVVRGQKRCVETWGERPGGDILVELGAPQNDAVQRPRGIFHTRLSYGPRAFETTVVDAMGAVHRYAGNALGLVERYVDPRGYVTTMHFDALGRIVAMTDGAGRTTRREYDALGRLITIVAPDGSSTRFINDDEAQTKTVQMSGGGRATERYARGKVVAYIDERGRKTLAEYDERGKNTRITWPTGSSDLLEYDAHANLIRYAKGSGAVYEYTYDLLGRPTSMKTPLGAIYRLDYDSRGDLVALHGPEGQKTAYAIDALRRVELARHAGGGETASRFVADALVEQVQADGSRFRLGYDALLRVCWVENPAGERFTVAYDAAGNPIRQKSFSGLSAGFEYDGAGRLAVALRPDETLLREQRDSLGRVIGREHGSGGGTRLTYDDAGRLIAAQNSAARVEYAYDESGRVARETQTVGGYRFAVRYRRDAEGNIVERSYSTGWSVALRADANGALEELRVESPRGSETLRFERDSAGFELARHRESDGLVIRTRRNVLGFPEQISVLDPGGEVLRERSYAWDARGPLASVSDPQHGERRYTLDAFGRPLEARGLGAAERFTFSPHGTAIPAEESWSLGPGGRPTRAGDVMLTWDRRGRLAERNAPEPASSWRFGYDEDDHLLEATRGDGLKVQYIYDPFGRRMAEICGGTATWFGWDGDSIVEEQTTTGGSVLRVFDRDGYTPLLEARDGEGFRLVITDAASTPWLFVNGERRIAELDLGAFGEVVHEQGETSALRFAGQRADTLTGLYYNQYRYYAPDLHVFTTPDPIGMRGSFQDVGFVPNATLYIDPLGLLTIITASDDPNLINNYYVNYPAQYPGARILTPSQVTPGSLAGETEVMIDTHGAPGTIQWGNQWIDGTALGNNLNAAGFNGSAPGARVDVIACNSATSPRGGVSVAQGVANTTGAQASGGRAFFDSSWLGNKGWSGLVSGMPAGNPPSGLRVNGFGSWVTDIRPRP